VFERTLDFIEKASVEELQKELEKYGVEFRKNPDFWTGGKGGVNMGVSQIEWLASDGIPGKSWNPVTGCTPVSPGCAHCYARAMARRLVGRCGYPADEPFRVTLHPEKLDEPLRWKKPKQVFVGSMGDLFHDQVPDEFIDRIMAVVAMAQNHTFMVLTKRPTRMSQYFAGANYRLEIERWLWPLPNLWLGVTAEDQQRANERIPVLLRIPAAVRFVSIEPMLKPVDLTKIITFVCNNPSACYGNLYVSFDTLSGKYYYTGPSGATIKKTTKLDWVICGCETGPGARPMEVDWARDLRNECQEAGVPFFLKAMQVDGKVVKLPELDGQKWDQVPKRGDAQCQS